MFMRVLCVLRVRVHMRVLRHGYMYVYGTCGKLEWEVRGEKKGFGSITQDKAALSPCDYVLCVT